MKKLSGFTILELMITLAIAGIVTAIAIPSMQTYIQNNRLTTQINTLVGHLALARSEAVKRSQQVIVCASNNSTSANPSCSGNDWASGWVIVVDEDGNGAFTAGEEVVRVQEILEGSNTINSTAGNNIVYDYRGYAVGNIGAFALCDDRGEAHKKSIEISNTGRVKKGGGAACS